eukprot:6928242-Prymnesium_polylepis.1
MDCPELRNLPTGAGLFTALEAPDECSGIELHLRRPPLPPPPALPPLLPSLGPPAPLLPSPVLPLPQSPPRLPCPSPPPHAPAVSRLLVLTASGMCGLLVWLTMYERCSATTRLERGRARVAVPPPAAPVQTYSYVMGTSDEVGYML